MRLTLLVAATLLASAQANASLEQQLRQCANLTDSSARLSCYDQLEASRQQTAALKHAQSAATPEPAQMATGATQAHAQQANPTQAEDSFGLEAKRPEGSTLDTIHLEVSSLHKDTYGALKITFTNGQVWKQTEGRNYPLKQGERVHIQKAALGSFLMGSEQRNAKVRVKRLK
ncbi:MAG: hypothetical protein ACRCVV_02055 [Shewanella sp.]